MNKQIIERIKEIKNKEALVLFFEELNLLINELGLTNENEKLSLTVRNDNRKRFSVNINSRLVLSITNVNKTIEFYYMIYEDSLSKIKNYLVLNADDYFSVLTNNKKCILVRIDYENLTSQIKLVNKLWLQCCADYLPQNEKSKYRRHHISELYELATNKELLGSYLSQISVDIATGLDFFTEEDFSNLEKHAGIRKTDNDEHNAIYSALKKTYEKVEYWAESISNKYFIDHGGFVQVLKKPTNQANIFEEYQWAKIYPFSHSPKELAFIVGINSDGQFMIKIETVGLKESDEKRKKYLKYRGNPDKSEIVLNIPKEEILSKNWKELLDTSSNFITSHLNEYEELIDLLSLSNSIKQEYSQTENNIHSMSLNTILYGPPGTGKTYNTVNKALELIGENIEGKTRQEIKSLYDAKVKDGQIVFTTFHQSMSYEDFIEGIKPLKPLTDDKFVKYDIQPGIFYNICETAKSNFQNSRSENKGKLNFDEAFEKFKEDWEKNPALKFPLKTEGYEFTIIGFTTTSIQFRKASGSTSHTLSIGTLKELYYGKEFDFKQGVGIYYPAVLKKIQSYKSEKSDEVVLKNYVLIIDEINRGNVSQIFGELITLIEEDKRLGKEEALEAKLPYSKEKFGVPPNLYILGTMNTADRSVEALDAALRRRFSFKEMPPDPELIAIEGKLKDKNGFLNEIDLPLLLYTINKRIEKLLDKDHQIGHSFFMPVSSLKELMVVFQNKIIPLLQEYFYGDYGKIGLVLGKGFFEPVNVIAENVFADFDDYDASGLSERIIYKIRDIAKMSEVEFKYAIISFLTK